MVNKGDNGSKPTKKQSEQTHKFYPKKTPNESPVGSSGGNQKQDKKLSRRNCYFCSKQHFLSRCKEFCKLTPKDRILFLQNSQCVSDAWAKGTALKIVKKQLLAWFAMEATTVWHIQIHGNRLTIQLMLPSQVKIPKRIPFFRSRLSAAKYMLSAQVNDF